MHGLELEQKTTSRRLLTYIVSLLLPYIVSLLISQLFYILLHYLLIFLRPDPRGIDLGWLSSPLLPLLNETL